MKSVVWLAGAMMFESCVRSMCDALKCDVMSRGVMLCLLACAKTYRYNAVMCVVMSSGDNRCPLCEMCVVRCDALKCDVVSCVVSCNGIILQFGKVVRCGVISVVSCGVMWA